MKSTKVSGFIKTDKGVDIPNIIMCSSFATIFGLLFLLALGAVCLGYISHLITAFASGVIAAMCIREIWKEVRYDDRNADSNIGASTSQSPKLFP